MKIYKSISALLAIASLSTGIQGQAVQPMENLRNEADLVLTTNTGSIYGSLLLPVKNNPVPVALIIAGSGPTDRNGNNPMMTNNSLKLLGEGLFDNNIASLRYDKRGIGKSQSAAKKEEDLRFDTYVDDAVEWIKLLKADKRFSKVIVIGHSEGSLIGIISAKKGNADAFISIAGAGQSADQILKTQLKDQPKSILDMTNPIIDSLVQMKIVKVVNPMLNSLFRTSIQPYLISWFKHDPAKEIESLSIPILIIQGTHDIQVRTEDAQTLAAANKKAKLVIIERMNHIFKETASDRQQNLATYNKPDLPIMPQLLAECSAFIRQ